MNSHSIWSSSLPVLLCLLGLCQLQVELIGASTLDATDSTAPIQLTVEANPMEQLETITYSFTSPPTLDLATVNNGPDLIKAYAKWHQATVKDTNACQYAKVLVWTANAGYGDSVNAMLMAYRLAVYDSRLFFVNWRTKTNAVWKSGLKSPGFPWDWADAIKKFPHCNFKATSIHIRSAYQSDSQHPDPTKAPRVCAISGTIVADHPLAGLLGNAKFGFGTVYMHLQDELITQSLLRPNSHVSKIMKTVSDQWKGNKVIGVQIRTGYADHPEPNLRPRNADFLEAGDELLFINKVNEILSTRYNDDPSVKIFIMTDHPQVQQLFATTYPDRITMVTDGPIDHCSPTSKTSNAGLLRMFTEWFLFRKVDFAVTTAWSLFGSTATSGLGEANIARIDNSKCGQGNHKPCHAAFAYGR